MKNFKPGQECVFRMHNTPGRHVNPVAKIPPDNSIVTLEAEANTYVPAWYLKGWLLDKNGNPQACNEKFLYPLVSDSVLSEELASISEHVTV